LTDHQSVAVDVSRDGDGIPNLSRQIDDCATKTIAPLRRRKKYASDPLARIASPASPKLFALVEPARVKRAGIVSEPKSTTV
jgi:hypothetical protein